jgi:hypothetical protein
MVTFIQQNYPDAFPRTRFSAIPGGFPEKQSFASSPVPPAN